MYLRRLLTLPLVAACLFAATGRAEEKKEDGKVTLEAKAVDAYVYKSLASIINVGADLYNSGQVMLCYTHYDGALRSLKPLLAHRPNLQKAIDEAVAKAKAAPIADRAFLLRDVIDQIRKDTSPNPSPVTPVAKSLWERLGGQKGVAKVIDDFVAATAADPKVDFTRGGKYKVDVPALKQKLIEMVSAVSGGPMPYTGKSMRAVHLGMGITTEQFDATVKHLADAFKKNGVKDEDAKLVLAVVEGTRSSIVEDKKPDPMPMTPYERFGGEKGITKIVDDFVVIAAKDPRVDFTRGGKFKLDDAAVAHLKKMLVEYFGNVLTGGKVKYTGKNMKDAHKGMGITEPEFAASLKALEDAMKKNGIKDDDVKLVLTVMGGLKNQIVEAKPVEPPQAMTLWDKLGGEKGVDKVVDDFFALVAKDPKANFSRGGMFKPDEKGIARGKKMLVAWISSQTGGPLKYVGKNMKDAHAGLGITSEEFDATGKDLAEALKKNGVKDDDAQALLGIFIKFKSDVVEPKKPEPEPTAKTLWDRLGGETGVAKIVDAYINAAIADRKLDFYRDPTFKPSKEQVTRLKEHTLEWISTQTGGPLKYNGKGMKEAHAKLKVTEAEFDAAVKLLDVTLKAHKVKDEDARLLLDKVKATRKEIVEK